MLVIFCLVLNRDPIARKLRLRRSKRDHEEEKQAKILKVFKNIINNTNSPAHYYFFFDIKLQYLSR